MDGLLENLTEMDDLAYPYFRKLLIVRDCTMQYIADYINLIWESLLINKYIME